MRLAAGGGANAGNYTGRTEKDEATQYDHCAVSPVHPARQHHETNGGYSYDRSYRRNSAEQCTLEPVYGIDYRP